MTHVIGTLEMRDQADRLFKHMRLRRLQEVREQEQQISKDRCSQYRERISSHKQGKKDVAVAAKKNKMEQACNELLYSWQKALVDSGNAQRDASETSRDTVSRINTSQKEALEKKLKSLDRQRSALERIEAFKENMENEIVDRNRRIQIRHELIVSDREDAKAKAEARKAKQEAEEKRALMALNVNGGPEIVEQPMIDRGTVSSQQKPSVVVQARVVRETTRADKAVVSNKAVEEENIVVKRLFKRCVDELRNKTKALSRARMARKSTTVVHNVEFLEAEFAALLALDRHPYRQYRVKNSSTLPPAEEGPVVVQTFEKVFLADPEKGDDSHDATYQDPEEELEDDFADDDEDYDEDDDVHGADDHEMSPRPPPRKTGENQREIMGSAMAAAAKTSVEAASVAADLKRREKTAPIRERILVKVAATAPRNSSYSQNYVDGAISAEQLDIALAPAVHSVVIPAPAGSIEGLGAASASWVPAPRWEKIASATAGYGLRDSGAFSDAGQRFFLDEEEEVDSAVEQDYRRTTNATADVALSLAHSLRSSGHLDMNDSIESLGALRPSGTSDLVDSLLASADAESDVEITRGSTDISPLRAITRQYNSPVRLSLKAHSHSGLLSVPQLHVSISSESSTEEVNLHCPAVLVPRVDSSKALPPLPLPSSTEEGITGGLVDASWYAGAHILKRETSPNISRASTFIARHDSVFDSNRASQEEEEEDEDEDDEYDRFNETTLSASLSDSPLDGVNYFAEQQRFESAEASLGSASTSSSIKSSSFHSSIPPSVSSYSGGLAVKTPASQSSSLTVRLQTGTTLGLVPNHSISFESLFIEDSEEEDEQGDDDDDEEDDEESDADSTEDDDVDVVQGVGDSRRFDFRSFNTAALLSSSASGNSSVDGPSSSLEEEEFNVETMWNTPKPFPPQSQHEGLGTFSRRPFKLVPSPSSKEPPVTVVNRESELDDRGYVSGSFDEAPRVALTDLLGMAGHQWQSSTAESNLSTSKSGSSSDLNISEILGLHRDNLWEDASQSGQEGDEDSNLADAFYDDCDQEALLAGTRIDQEIAEIRSRLLQAVQNTLSATRVSSTSTISTNSAGASSSTEGGSSPFFSFHNKLDDPASSTSRGIDSDSIISQYSMQSQSRLSGGHLSSTITPGGDLSSSSGLAVGMLSSTAEQDKSVLSTLSLDL